ncbi:hypothetical protein FI667_g12042, partial [Globisporangium splendens]
MTASAYVLEPSRLEEELLLLLLLASAVAVCQYDELPQAGALSYFVQYNSDYLDSNHFYLALRLAAHEAATPECVDRHFKGIQFGQALVFVVRNDNLEMAKWLCNEYCPTGFATKAMFEAVKFGNLRLVKWLFKNSGQIIESSSFMDEADTNGH